MYPEVFFWRRRMIHIPPTYAGVPGFPPPPYAYARTRKLTHEKFYGAEGVARSAEYVPM